MDKHRFPLIIEAREIYSGCFQGDRTNLVQVYLHLDMNYGLGDIEPLQRLQDFTNYKNGYRMVLLNLLVIPQSKLEVHHKLFVPLLQPLV